MQEARNDPRIARTPSGRAERAAALAVAGIAALAAVLQGCAPGQASDLETGRSLVHDASALTRSELGVATWKIEANSERAEVIGVDGTGSPQVELIVRQASAPTAEGVEIEVVRPAAGKFVLSPAGQIDRAVTDHELRLAAALSRDLGQLEQPASTSSAVADSASHIGPNTVEDELHYQVWGGLFGMRDNYMAYLYCKPGHVRDHYVAYSDYGCSCWINGWATEADTDCRVLVHVGAAPFWSDTCHVFVYGHTP